MTKASPDSLPGLGAALVGGILSISMLLTGCSVGDGPQTSNSSNSADAPITSGVANPDVREYVLQALDFIEENAIRIPEIEWEQIRTETLSHTTGATSYADSYNDISFALSKAGGPHSALLRPEEVAARTDSQSINSNLAPPSAKIHGKGIVLLEIPAFSAPGGGEARKYVEAGVSAIRRHSNAASCGWIVDLRHNTGGNMWPMLTALTPLLPDGSAMSFIERDGRKTMVTVSGNSVSLGGKQILSTSEKIQKHLQQPVAMLQSGRTASSGEAVLISLLDRENVRTFGTETFGFTTGNITEELSDGAVMLVTDSHMATAGGTIFTGPIEPMEKVRKNTVQAAANWLRTTC